MYVFDSYAAYYNLMYSNKDYRSECEYLHTLIKMFGTGGKTILDLGCGSGRHDVWLEKFGYCVTGVELSSKMLELTAQLPENNIRFLQGDARDIDLCEKYDVVTSLFHVLSYQQENSDVEKLFANARRHLNPGGIFICDCWYGPGVMNERPEVRHAVFEDNTLRVSRVATPSIRWDKNIVDVHYSLDIVQKESGDVRHLQELHPMRYFFLPELDLFSKHQFLSMIPYRWMSLDFPEASTWNIVIVNKAD